MPDLTKTSKLLQGFSNITDSGYLKQEDSEYSFLQNIRGWGRFGTKRRGVLNAYAFDSGVMGIFDAHIEGDNDIVDGIFVQTNDGSLWKFSRAELTFVWDYLHATTAGIYIQSPDLTWWRVGVDATGVLIADGLAYTGAYQSADLVIKASDLFGFRHPTKCFRLSVNAAPGYITTEYAYSPMAYNLYEQPLAFAYGYGPTFYNSTLARFRLIISNAGIISTYEL